MAILAFHKPENVIMVDAGDYYGKFEFSPLEPGFGITIGNALRRILLSSLEGNAVTAIKINGISHEYETIAGVIDDVTSIILNLKQIRFKRLSSQVEKETVIITITGKHAFKAGHLNESLSDFEVLNPEVVICRMEPTASFTIEITVENGRGYMPVEENSNLSSDIGIIGVDAVFTPIRNVSYTVEPERVEQKTDYDKLIMAISTDGSIHPKDALRDAARILIQHFAIFSDGTISQEIDDRHIDDDFDEDSLRMRQMLKTKLTDLDLSVRALNCLKAADLETLGDLCRITRAELLKFRNFGKKSLTELDETLDRLNLSFGMNLSKYKLEKD
ncbi:MAG: DNA-directed RNA polymerase subunit alpha [Prevotellaceae bacterium]|jgi:DNA-directed RNA polymerase subunit alpha|nr:DNA-directed RNA polymerase subunit alpha [Prevotellaceae bacterium]